MLQKHLSGKCHESILEKITKNAICRCVKEEFGTK